MFRSTVELLLQAGHDVRTIERDSRAIRAPAGYVRAAISTFHSSTARREMANLVRSFVPDAVHLHNLYPLLSPSVLAPCVDAGVPIVMRLADLSLICPTGHLVRAGKTCTLCLGGHEYNCLLTRCSANDVVKSAYFALRTAVTRLRRVFLDRVDLFTTGSEFLRNAYLSSGFPSERVVVLPNFVPIPPRAALPSEGSYVGYVGRLTEEKGIQTLLDAARIYGAPVRIAGAGPMLNAAVAAAPSNVRFVGLLQRFEVADFISHARCLVVPSLASETFSLAAAEAMAVGVPVVASRIGALPETVADCGLLTTPGDPIELAEALVKLHADPALGNEIGRRGRIRAMEEFSAALYYRRLLKVYAAVARRSAPPSRERNPWAAEKG